MDKINVTKNAHFFFRELQLITVLHLIRDSYMSWSTSFASLQAYVGFSIFDSVLFLLKFIFLFSKNCWEYCFTQTNNHNRFLRPKFYYIYTVLKIHNLPLTSPCYKHCQNISLNFDAYIHTSEYFLSCLTKQGRKCLTNEVNLHICSWIKRVHNDILIGYFNLICYVILS